MHHWFARRRASYKNAFTTLDQYSKDRIEHAREKIRDGGEIAEIENFVSRSATSEQDAQCGR